MSDHAIGLCRCIIDGSFQPDGCCVLIGIAFAWVGLLLVSLR